MPSQSLSQSATKQQLPSSLTSSAKQGVSPIVVHPKKKESVGAKFTPPAKKKKTEETMEEEIPSSQPLDMEVEKDPHSGNSDSVSENSNKWNGKKCRSASQVFDLLGADGNFLRMTDTINLSDVWVLPIAVRRTGSLNFALVDCNVYICGTTIKCRPHTFRMSAEEICKMVYLARKLRLLCFPDEDARLESDFAKWMEFEFSKFLSDPNIVRGDSTRAAFAEFLLCNENFRVNRSDEKCLLRIVFRKSNEHIYTIDEPAAGDVENPNIVGGQSINGKYSFYIESRVMVLPVAYI